MTWRAIAFSRPFRGVPRQAIRDCHDNSKALGQIVCERHLLLHEQCELGNGLAIDPPALVVRHRLTFNFEPIRAQVFHKQIERRLTGALI